MLQNVHLMQSWLPLLERAIDEASTNLSTNPEFRVIITAEPPPAPLVSNLPESLLKSCVKVANEAPADLLSNLSRAWSSFSQDDMDSSSSPNTYKHCLFVLCWYHAIVLGRRRFGTQGWSRRYAFNAGDLNVCANILLQYIKANTNPDGKVKVPWDDLRYNFGEIMYGGHITDSWDRRTNNAYLTTLFGPSVLLPNTLELGMYQ